MATKSIRDSADQYMLLRLHENDIYASQVAPTGDRRRRAPWPPSPGFIPLVLREVNEAGAEQSEESHRH